MNANDLTFGIEIETSIPASLAHIVGSYHNPAAAQAAGLPEGWKAKSDGSIIAGRGRVGCEFVSPVLKGADGIRSVLAAVKRLNELGAKVNASTGFHVHVGWAGDAKSLTRLTTLVSNMEEAIYACTGTIKRRESRWCRSVRQHGNAATATSRSSNDRYHVLNLTNLRPGGKQTVEFRAFAGTLNVIKIIGYIRLCLALVERALKAKRTSTWTPPVIKETSGTKRDGDGQTAVARLFYRLGWVKGTSTYCFGDVTAEGAPDAKAIRVELMRLAKQYDAEVEASPARQAQRAREQYDRAMNVLNQSAQL